VKNGKMGIPTSEKWVKNAEKCMKNGEKW